MENHMINQVLDALKTIRAPIQQGEYDLHALVMRTLTEHGVPCMHEAKLAHRCRIDILCGSVGVEIKRGKPERARLVAQLTRYAQCDQLSALVVVAEKSVALPHTLAGKSLHVICLNRLWGIAL